MKRSHRDSLLAFAAALIGAACTESTAPMTRFAVGITDISVPEVVASDVLRYTPQTVLLPPEDHVLPFRVVFGQPTGVDSVRVIHSAGAPADAP